MFNRSLALVFTAAVGCFCTLSALSQSQVDFFEKNGYLVIENFLSEDETTSLLLEIDRLVKSCDLNRSDEVMSLLNETNNLINPEDLNRSLAVFSTADSNAKNTYFIESSDKIAYFFETAAVDSNGNLLFPPHQALNKIAHNLHDLNPTFNRITYQDKFTQIPKDLGWTSPSVIQSMVIFKQPLIGGAVPCHQDLTFLFTNPNTTLGFWMPLEDATLDNGCLWVVPGGHLTTLRKRFVKNDSNKQTFTITLDESPLPEEGMIPVEMQKGSLLLIHSLLPHKSLANHSLKSRIAYTFHIIDQTSEYPSSNWLQRGPETPLRPYK